MDVCVIVAKVGQDKTRAVPSDVDGQRSCDAIGRRSDVLGAINVRFYGSTLLPGWKVDDLAFECVWQRWLRSADEGTKRVERSHEQYDGFETEVLETPGVQPLFRRACDRSHPW